MSKAAVNHKMLQALELADAALSGANMNMNVVDREVRSALAAAKALEPSVDEYERGRRDGLKDAADQIRQEMLKRVYLGVWSQKDKDTLKLVRDKILQRIGAA